MEVEKDAEAVRRAVQATAKDTKGIFRFNPGKQRKTFPDYNPYTISRCRDCDIAKGKMKLSRPVHNEVCDACQCIRATANENGADKRLEKHDRSKWEHTYISRENNGYVATELERIKEANVSKSEKQKFEKEMRMCKTVADNGHDVEYLKGVNRPKGQTYDICMDGMKADLECITGGAGNLVKYVKKALKKQGAKAVVFEIPNHSAEYYKALTDARRKCQGKIFFYILDEKVLKELIKNEATEKRPRGGTRSKGPVPSYFYALQNYNFISYHQTKSRKRLKKSTHEKRNQPHVGRHQGGVYGRVRPQLRHREFLWPGMAAPKKPHQRPIQACPIQSPTDCPVLFLTDCPVLFLTDCPIFFFTDLHERAWIAE